MNATLARFMDHRPDAQPLPRVRFDQAVARVRSEFLEMPGLCLTFEQARRLWGFDDSDCAEVLRHLVSEGFLRFTARGAYLRPTAA
ncbi:MAG: hypothetical protein AB7Q16_24835 [Vicinamibacterales bacterium]